LDSPLRERVESMLSRYSSWPSHFSLAFERGRAESPALRPRALVICGMGTSASAAEHAAEILGEAGASIPVFTVRSYEPPAWLSSSDFVVAVSYSGNTWETLECARRAASRRAGMAVIVSGGRLASLAAEGGWRIVRVEPGEYGRTSMAYLLGGILGVASEASGAPGRVDELAGHVLEAFKSSKPGEVEGVARSIGSADFVAVASCGRMAPASRWWRTELAENTKVTARDDAFPESGHNDVVALQVKPRFRGLLVSIHNPDDKPCEAMLRTAESLYERASYSIERLVLEGPSLAYKLGRSLILAGYASTIAAGYRGVDPHETPNLSEYKEGVSRLAGSPTV